MKPKTKFDRALNLMREASETYDKAARLFESLGIVLHTCDRPIEEWYGKPMFSIHKGIEAVAEILWNIE